MPCFEFLDKMLVLGIFDKHKQIKKGLDLNNLARFSNTDSELLDCSLTTGFCIMKLTYEITQYNDLNLPKF